jgi:hypothetical protein
MQISHKITCSCGYDRGFGQIRHSYQNTYGFTLGNRARLPEYSGCADVESSLESGNCQRLCGTSCHMTPHIPPRPPPPFSCPHLDWLVQVRIENAQAPAQSAFSDPFCIFAIRQTVHTLAQVGHSSITCVHPFISEHVVKSILEWLNLFTCLCHSASDLFTTDYASRSEHLSYS